MTKERLEELIKQRGKIWYDGHFEIELNPEQYSIREAFGTTLLWYQPKDEPSGYDWSWELDVLREDIDRAKWEHDMFVERTERFEPPMWDDIDKDYTFMFYVKDDFYYFKVHKRLQNIDFVVNNHYLLVNHRDEECTKENYEKACEIVRELFLKGGK